MARREHPLYENAEWPDYEFHEFPMMIYPGAKNPTKPEYWAQDDDLPRGKVPGQLKFEGVIVENEEEAQAVLKGDAKTVTREGVKHVQTEEDRRLDLIAECERAGITVDRRWGIGRLQSALEEQRSDEVM